MKARLSYANVMATLAVVLAIGGGTWAIASGRIGSRDIKQGGVRGRNIHNETISARKLRPDTLKGRQINELRLDASAFTGGTSESEPSCDPAVSSPFTNCVTANLRLPQAARVLMFASGGQHGNGGPASGVCQLEVDGTPAGGAASPGESSNSTTSAATNGFSLNTVSDRLKRGRHSFELACNQVSGDTVIENPSISGVMIGSGSYIP